MRKLLRAKTFTALSVLAILAAASAMRMPRVPRAQAASSPTDPLVDIVVDATTPSCFFVRTEKVGTLAATKTRIACAPYTLVEFVSMVRSRAIARQEPYVLHPNANATRAVWRAYSSQMHQIAESKRLAHRASATAQAESPAIVCNIWSKFEGNPIINGDFLDVYIIYYSNAGSGCNQNSYQTSVVQGYTSPNALYMQYRSFDDGGPIPVPVWYCYCYIGTNTRTHNWGGVVRPSGGIDYMEFGENQTQAKWNYELGPLN